MGERIAWVGGEEGRGRKKRRCGRKERGRGWERRREEGVRDKKR